MQDKPAVYSTFLLSLLAELYQTLPEAGDLDRAHLKSQKHVRCETRGFYDVQIVLQNTLNEADGVLLAKPNSRKQ